MAKAGELLGTSSGVDGEEIEHVLLEFRWPRMHDELVRGIECGGDRVSRECGEVGEKGFAQNQALERMNLDPGVRAVRLLGKELIL